jgi:ribosomal protein S18 acetylase RimI-like enzyme
MKGVSIRAIERPRDYAALQALDFGFSTRRIFKVSGGGNTLRLAAIKAPAQVEKRYIVELEDDAWTDGWVAERGGQIVGFAAVGLHRWNRRLAIYHFYVDRRFRRRGIGRRLMEKAAAHGRAAGAATLWAETSHLNHPAIVAYRRLGFEICGFDLSLYRGTASPAEFSVFVSRPIGRGSGRRAR